MIITILVLETFHPPGSSPVPISGGCPHPQLMTTTNLLSVSINMPRNILRQWNPTMCLLRLASLTFHGVFEVHPSCSMFEQFVPFYCQIKSHSKAIPSCVHPFTNWTFGLFWVFWRSWTMLLWAFTYKSLCRRIFSFLLNRHPVMELLCCMLH